jgi:hypothetical protein
MSTCFPLPNSAGARLHASLVKIFLSFPSSGRRRRRCRHMQATSMSTCRRTAPRPQTRARPQFGIPRPSCQIVAQVAPEGPPELVAPGRQQRRRAHGGAIQMGAACGGSAASPSRGQPRPGPRRTVMPATCSRSFKRLVRPQLGPEVVAGRQPNRPRRGPSAQAAILDVSVAGLAPRRKPLGGAHADSAHDKRALVICVVTPESAGGNALDFRAHSRATEWRPAFS